MTKPLSRREALKRLGAASAGMVLDGRLIRGQATDIMVAGQPVEIAVATLSNSTARLTIRPVPSERSAPLAATGELVSGDLGNLVARGRATRAVARARAGDLVVRFSDRPPTIQVETPRGALVQRLTFDATAPGMSFLLGQGPLLGLGQGGPQFDRKGSVDQMINGQRGYRLATHGGRMPIQWLVGTDGWALFIHQPYGTFDFTGADGKFMPSEASAALPLDVFVVSSRDPKVIMREYARITGLPEMPPLWSLGYLQSHRTLAGPDEILGVARTFREKRLPCDALISTWGPSSRRRGGTPATVSSPGIRPTSPIRRRNSMRCTPSTSRWWCTQ